MCVCVRACTPGLGLYFGKEQSLNLQEGKWRGEGQVPSQAGEATYCPLLTSSQELSSRTFSLDLPSFVPGTPSALRPTCGLRLALLLFFSVGSWMLQGVHRCPWGVPDTTEAPVLS